MDKFEQRDVNSNKNYDRRNPTEMNDRSSPIGDFFFSRFSTKHDSVDKLRRLSRADSICSEQSENTKDLIDRVGYLFCD